MNHCDILTLIQGNGCVRVKIQFNAQINFVFIKLAFVFKPSVFLFQKAIENLIFTRAYNFHTNSSTQCLKQLLGGGSKAFFRPIFNS